MDIFSILTEQQSYIRRREAGRRVGWRVGVESCKHIAYAAIELLLLYV